MATALRKLAEPDRALPEVEAWARAAERKSLLRFITCGSVDDGKSTLIGRLLYDSKMLSDDQVERLEADSRRGAEGKLDFASLVDGLAAEREQGITIDVAYRFFATDKRKFIVADTPGHEQYTRNMATGASTAELAVILIDARKGVLPQTRRHSHIAQLLGVRHIVLAVNKMDLVGYDRGRFDAIVADFRAFADQAGIAAFAAIPVSGLAGDNISAASSNMDWYAGPTLIEHLEQVPVAGSAVQGEPFRMPVQWVNRPNQDFRGYAGTIAGGEVRRGMAVRIEPSGRRSTIDRIVTFDGDLPFAVAGQAVTLVLADEVDCSRGDAVVADGDRIASVDRIEANLVWMAGEAMVPGRAYWLKIGTRTVAASVSRVREVRDIDSLAALPGRPLGLNEIGRCELVLDSPVPVLPYAESRTLGGFVLIDRASHATVAAGMVAAAERKSVRERDEPGTGRVIWLLGKSPDKRLAFARRAQQRLQARGRPTLILDTAALRAGLSQDLGHSEADEAENRRRTGEVARLMSRAGVTVLIVMDVPADEERPGTDLDIAGAGVDWDWSI